MPQERERDRDHDEFERLTPAGADSALEGAGRSARHAEQIEEGRAELRPRGVGELLDLGLDHVRSRFALCVGLATVAWIPIRIVATMLKPTAVAAGTDIERITEALSGSFLANMAVTVGQLLVAAITARIVADAIEGRESRIGSTLRLAITRLPGLIAIGVVVYCIMVVGLCLCIVPGLVVMWLMAPCAYIYVLEGVNLRTAVRRSTHISCGRLFSAESFFAFWRWAGIMIVSTLLVLPFTTLAAFADVPQMRDWMLDKLSLSMPAYEVLSVVLGALFMGIAIAIQAGVLTVYYLDCRIRREGLGLETWLDRLRPAPAAPVPGSTLP